MKTLEDTASQTIPIQSGIELLDTGRNAKPRRRHWEPTLKELQKTEDGSFLVAKGARAAINLAAKRLRIRVRTQEVDPYHVRVILDN